MKRYRFFNNLCILCLTGLFFGSAVPAAGQDVDYLSTEEVIAIGAASLTMFQTGLLVKKGNANIEPRWIRPPGFDAVISRFFGREAGLGPQNFLDSDLGSALTVGGASLWLLAADLEAPRDDKSKDAWQDQFLFFSGTLATKGVTDLFKGLVARQRPLLYCAPELAAQRENPDRANDHYSFFSGHASSAFYAMTFVNKRIRAAMRQELDPEDYRRYRWIPSTLAFGWATFVAYSRIQAYRHYLTDVLAGALVGYLMGELYYSFNGKLVRDESVTASPVFVQVRFAF
jgi:membrane-associated phospholipid phosphatase